MEVLVNGLLLNKNFTGVQYYTENLFFEISNQIPGKYDISIILPNEYNEKLNSTNIKITSLETNSLGRVGRIIYENIKIPFFLKEKSFDIFHSPSYLLPFFINTPAVVTIHDLIAVNYPEFSQTESILYYKLLQKRSVKKASKIIAVSNTVKKEIIEKFKVPDEKIETIYHGINPIFKKECNSIILNEVRRKYGLPEKYILFVGNIEPKKNLDRLLLAYDNLLKQEAIRHKLVIVGKRGWKCDSFFKLISDLSIGKSIIFTGYVPISDLPSIYTMSDLFVFPSLYEGFGIPPLEAMACEIPVLTSNQGALPEITNGNSIEVEPFNIISIAKGIVMGLTEKNLRSELSIKGKLWSRQFTWERAAKETLKVYDEVINSN